MSSVKRWGTTWPEYVEYFRKDQVRQRLGFLIWEMREKYSMEVAVRESVF